ncbi:MAG: cytochrome C biogenesis protein CcmH [Rhodospirillaceae bacterium]|nr:cytochrome C biogenesis protein CcmH [Rhodospirillaceae bacterium]|tara:strand:+ start:53 stop:529 length:477 start_codon:yes stop_codon:yes gene_type:complete
MNIWRAFICGILLAAFLGTAAHGLEPQERLTDPGLEARARALSQNIRCLVCQNQSIDDSNASLAKDLRIIVRRRLVNGNTDAEILDFLVKRYGDFILLTPPFKPSTYVLWFGPVFFSIIGLIMVYYFMKRRRKILPEKPLTTDESNNLNKLINQKSEK